MKKPLSEFLEFLNHSPTAWHATDQIKTQLITCHFQELQESAPWKLKPGGRYFVTRNGSSLAAFLLPHHVPAKSIILGTHTDSPSLKLKPSPEFQKEQMTLFAVEPYGAPLLSSWLNRDLGIAGRIYVTNREGKMTEKLVRIDHSSLVIPQLAIHLDRTVNETGLILNKQEHLSAIAASKETKNHYFHSLLEPHLDKGVLVAHDLFLYPLEAAQFLGPRQEMIAGHRLDNLSSVHAALKAICSAKESDHHLAIALFWDNEEIGSETAQGAASPFLSQLIERILLTLGKDRESYWRLLSQSLCLSIDLSHALHPNYPEKSDSRHAPLLNHGIVLKSNAQQRYASDAASLATVIRRCHELDLPFQHFSMRNDLPCGSTIGPITAARTGIPTVDIGIPQLSMHSCRELVGSQDHLDMCQLLSAMMSA